MSDLISREDAIEAVVCHIWHTPPETRKLFNCENYVRDIVEEALERLPSAEATQGEWIEVEDYNGDIHYKCDQCGEEWTFPYGTPSENNANFCPNCGARMENKE